MTAQAGVLLSKVASAAYNASLTGLEFAAGIPGTLGGAVRMNAGAYGGEMKQVLESAVVLTQEGELLTIPVEELGLAYRTSVVEKKDYVVVEATLRLKKGEQAAIREMMDDLKQRRVTKQPLEFGSAGSTFKRPEGYFAGKLIEDAGLRGFRIGDAQVSEKHCGFVINRGNATAAQVCELMQEVVKKVKETSGVTLEPEVKRIESFRMRFVIVTGMSGAGKSTALKMLEDMGYFCVDNLPIPLLPGFVQMLQNTDTEMKK